MRSVLLFFILFLGTRAWAGFGAQFTGFYLVDNFTQTTLTSQSKSYYTTELYYSLQNLRNLYFGIELTGVAQNDVVANSTTNYSSQDYGAVFSYEIDNGHHWTIAGAYNPSASSIYEVTGAAAKTWTGTSYWGRLGCQTELKNGIYVGLHLTYYNADYTSETQSGVAQTVSVHRNWVLPVFSFSYWHQ